MRSVKTERGFIVVEHDKYPPDGSQMRLVQESSAIGDYEDSFERAGSSYLWVGENHHLNREEIQELIDVLQYWLENKRLPEEV